MVFLSWSAGLVIYLKAVLVSIQVLAPVCGMASYRDSAVNSNCAFMSNQFYVFMATLVYPAPALKTRGRLMKEKGFIWVHVIQHLGGLVP